MQMYQYFDKFKGNKDYEELDEGGKEIILSILGAVLITTVTYFGLIIL